MKTELLFEKLWNEYIAITPAAQDIYNLFTSNNEVIQNDHIAFRTFNCTRFNIDEVATPFLKAGYIEKGNYTFEEKHLFAKHYEHPSVINSPRIFISELILEDFSDFLQYTIEDTISKANLECIKHDELIFSGNIWGTPSYEIYQKLRTESEYAAWLYVFGFRANHFTISINALKKFDTIEKVNEFLKQNGFLLNSSGGEIKGTKEELLQQSSTMAEIKKIHFVEGEYDIPTCYYEFAIRYKDSNNQLYNGFIAKSADKIFESTNFYKQ
jgi:hypothetical protein